MYQWTCILGNQGMLKMKQKKSGKSMCFFHFRCFSSLSPFLLPGPSPEVCLLALLLFRNILSIPLRASVR
uniref:Uncharacterized protein n=1 Tax=Xenopus tropicalis TaxID=8364 RepID=A0A6I8RU91_XENTR